MIRKLTTWLLVALTITFCGPQYAVAQATDPGARFLAQQAQQTANSKVSAPNAIPQVTGLDPSQQVFTANCFSRVRAGQGRCRAMYIGDSTIAGVGSGPGATTSPYSAGGAALHGGLSLREVAERARRRRAALGLVWRRCAGLRSLAGL